MKRKSDSASVRKISATDASRSFSRVLDDVEKGKVYVVHRRGRDVCHMVPVVTTSRAASECLSILRSRPPVVLDDRFGRDLMEVLHGERIEGRPWD